MHVVVTGASQGIGAAVCRRLAADAERSGDQLKIAACGSHHAETLNDLVDELRASGIEATALLGDLADAETPARLIAAAADAFGGLDAVVSNAGIAQPGALLDVSVSDWDRLFDINTRSTWLLAKAAHPWLRQSGGSLIAVASMSGIDPQPGMGAYSVSKAALIMLTRLIAQEWADDGIRANCVSPGLVLTPMTEQAYADADFKRRREAFVPQRRIADPTADIAGVVAFLLGPDAAYCSGQNIVVDGGLTDSVLRALPARTI